MLRAQDTPPASAAPAAAPAAEAAPAAPTGPTPTLDQRVGILEAYLTNSDPTVPLKTAKDKDGNPTIPDGLAANSPTAANSGPGHNAWMMASAALVLFMTLPGLALFYGGPRPQEERAQRLCPKPRLRRSGDRPLVGLRLLAGLRRQL
ncbi:MAG: hypothetical protein WDN28_04300 [Chthoniobacter sp.]